MTFSVWRRFAGSFQFLTVMPVKGDTAPPAYSAVFFPFTGAAIGAFAGLVAKYGGMAFGRALGSLLALAALLFISGGLHEDGLADVADAIRAGRSRERMLEILKDSRIGAWGAITLIVFFLLRWQAIENMNVPPVAGLAAAVALSRASMVITASSAPPLGTGLGHAFAAGCNRATVAAVLCQCALVLVILGANDGLGLALATAALCASVITAARAWFTRRLSGVNGDCLGATCVAVETAALLVMTWRRSF